MNASGRRFPALSLVLIVAAGFACETQKSSNPLSATVAGPMPGVNITPPVPVNPASGAKVAVNSQPITLVVGNVSTNSPRPMSYVFEVSTDAAFTNKVFTREGITAGANQTSLRLPDPLATGRSYYWHSRAQDGANTGPFSAPTSFTVYTPVVISPPELMSPANNETVTSQRPTLTWRNAVRTGPAGTISYEIEVADNDAFANRFDDWAVGEAPNQTSAQLRQDAPAGVSAFWHVRAYDSQNVGPWSQIRVFVIPAAPAPPPGGGGGGGKPCGPPYPNNGPAIASCVAAQYPQYLAPVGSFGQRVANMEFLRDRIIETGICGGMDLGWNRKTSGAISSDAITWRHGGITNVVDIGGLNAQSVPITLHWLIVGGVPGYVFYTPRPSC